MLIKSDAIGEPLKVNDLVTVETGDVRVCRIVEFMTSLVKVRLENNGKIDYFHPRILRKFSS
jgi:hypothetical protein